MATERGQQRKRKGKRCWAWKRKAQGKVKTYWTRSKLWLSRGEKEKKEES